MVKCSKGSKPTAEEKCTGCMVCMYVCPTQAIKQVLNEECGFLYPEIDEKKCIHCNKCAQMCPINREQEEMSRNSICYAAMASDDIRKESSSGGAFAVIAKYVLDNNGLVCGAAFNDNMKLTHTLIENSDQLVLLQKSKYVQSNMCYVWDDLEKAVRSGRIVLFCGTPCQCSAVKNCFGERDNLFLIDILCMGVASQHCFDKYCDEEFPEENVCQVNFRSKINGWTQELILEVQTNRERHVMSYGDSSYFLAFLKTLTIRESCETCNFAGKERVGDFTLGDFWGIGGYNYELNDGKGTSMVLVNTSKGKRLFDEIQDVFKLVKEVPLEKAISGNRTLSCATNVNPKRKIFWDRYSDFTLKENVKQLLDERADCGIINYWYTNDHGAILTAYALQQLLSDMGYTSKLINLCPKRYQSKRKGGISEKFEINHLNSTFQIYNSVTLTNLNDKFKYFIVGSDQVFRAEWVSDDWFLQFVKLGIPKIAISASFGISELSVSERRKHQIAYLLNRFNGVSVREKSGVFLCEKYGGVKAQWILDPVFMVDKRHYYQLIRPIEDKKYCFCYIRDLSEMQKEKIEHYCSEKGLTPIYNNDLIEVEKFISYIYYSSCIITDSYHGLCFSIIFNKKVYCYYNEKRGNTRFESLIEQLGLVCENFVKEENVDLTSVCPIEKYEQINENMLKLVEHSRKWVEKNLQNPSKVSIVRLLLYRIRLEVLTLNLNEIIAKVTSVVKKGRED